MTYANKAYPFHDASHRTAITTTWSTLKDYLAYGYTENHWSTAVQTGTFDM